MFHLIRWFSAFLVLIGHIPMVLLSFYPNLEFSKVFIYLSNHAHSAVIIFFILSGYLIGYSVDIKILRSQNYSVKDYLVDRFSRIYSVIIPAILLTIILDFIGRLISPQYMNENIFPQDNYFIRLFINLFSLQGTWGNRIQFGSNPALWSVGYEFSFYLIFAIYVWKKRDSFKDNYVILIFIVFSIVRGYLIIFYFLIWLLGFFAYKYSKSNSQKTTNYNILLIFLLLALFNHLINYLNVLNITIYFRDLTWGIIIAYLFTFNFKNSSYFNGFRDWERVNKFLADFSFSLYAFHLPILYFIVMLLNEYKLINEYSLTTIILILLFSTYGLSLLLYNFTEIKRSKFKAIVNNLTNYY